MDKFLKVMKKATFSVLFTVMSLSLVSAQNELKLFVDSYNAECGDTIVVPIKVQDFTQVVALDFSMTWNANSLQLIGPIGNLNAGIGITPFNFGPYPNPDNDTLTFQWFNAFGATLNETATLFSLTFIVKGDGGLIAPINFGNQYTAIACGKIVNNIIVEVDVDTTNGVVLISDAVNPQLTCPNDTLIIVPPGTNQLLVGDIDPFGSDNCAIDSIKYTLTGATVGTGLGSASGSIFNIGQTGIEYYITDYAGNSALCAFTVTIRDTILRLFVITGEASCDDPGFRVDITAQNFNQIASLQFGLSWDLNELDFQGLTNFNPALGLDPFTNFGPVGGIDDTLTLSWFKSAGVTLPDDAVLFSITFGIIGTPGTNSLIQFGNMPSLPIEASKAQPFPNLPVVVGVETFNAAIAIVDNEDPTLVCPDDITITVPQTTPSQVVQNIDPVASDNCGTPTVEYLITGATQSGGIGSASGTSFNLGTSEVQYLATDQGGNQTFCSFNVTIIEDTLIIIVNAPEVLCTDTTVQICITSTGFNNLASLQFAVQWNGVTLNYDTINQTNSLLNLGGGNFGPNTGINDTLTFSWFNPSGVSIADDSILFCILFDIIGGLNSTSELNIISYPSVPIEASVAKPLPQFPVVIPVGVINDLITITDNEPPVLSPCPPNVIVQNIPDQCDAIVNWTDPTATDNCTVDVNVVCTPGSGSTFPLGITNVVCIATDESNLADTCSFTVTVIDSEDPVLDCNFVDIIAESASDSCGTTLNWTLPTATDNCDPNVQILGPLPSGFFAPGAYTITYTANDKSGNSSSCSFEIFVLDLIPPVFTDCPADYTIDSNTDSCTAIIAPQIPLVSDNCDTIADFSFKVNADPTFYLPGEEVELPLGQSTIIWYAFDNFANLDSCAYVITVSGGGSYEVICPSDTLIQLAENICTATVDWIEPTFSGGCGNNANLEFISTLPSGSIFSPGNTSVVYFLVDNITGDTVASCAFEITLVENTAPVFIDCPGTINVIADEVLCGADVTWNDPVALDNCSDSLDLTYTVSGPSPGFFPNGVYTVTYTATDEAGNSATCLIVIAVCDTVAPIVQNCPGDTVITLAAVIDLCSAVVTWEDPIFTDNCDSSVSVFQIGQPGSFPTGQTTITYIGTDDCGNSTTCSFNISIFDVIDPNVTCPQDVTVSANGIVVSDPSSFIDSLVVTECKEVEVYYTNPTGSDNCSNTTTIQIDQTGIFSGSVFPSGGTYTLIFLVSDASGNSDTCSVRVTVDPYILTVNASPNPACEDDNVQLNAETILNGTYSWSGPENFSANIQNPIIPLIGLNNTGPYTVTVNIANCTTAISGTVVVNVLDPPRLTNDFFEIFSDEALLSGNIIINDTINFSANANITILTQILPQQGVLVNNFDGTITFTPAAGFVGIVEFVYEVCYQECPLYCDDAIVRIEVKNRNESCKPNNLITPNNDNRNDYVVIECIIGTPSKFPNNALKVYNQWGDQVFAASPYMNNWGGTYQGDAGAPLPDGTYYYVFTRGDNSDPVTGFITILR